MQRRRSRRADLAALQARVVRAEPPRADGRSRSPAAGSAAADTFCLIAGPCTVESREQTLAVARAVAAGGAVDAARRRVQAAHVAVRVQGPRRPGLEILAEARAETGLPVVTELLDTQHADVIAEHADVVQIGARNMQNYALLEVAGKLGKPVLLKRGLSSSLDELLQAADYILKEGNEDVILCERGIRTFETATRFTLDLGAVPWLKLHTHLPVIVDPSHAAGDRRLVEPLSPRGRRGRRRRHHRRGRTRTPRPRCATARRRCTPRTSPDYAARRRRARRAAGQGAGLVVGPEALLGLAWARDAVRALRLLRWRAARFAWAGAPRWLRSLRERVTLGSDPFVPRCGGFSAHSAVHPAQNLARVTSPATVDFVTRVVRTRLPQWTLGSDPFVPGIRAPGPPTS